MGKQTIFINVGDVFTRLTVIDIVKENGKKKYKCLCECGSIVYHEGKYLVRGDIKSCGCFKKDMGSLIRTRHGDSRTRLYKIYHAMINRCLMPSIPNYINYGGRGITVCNEWLESYVNFREWALSNGYEEHLSIDRIDNNGNYEPFNCRWATKKEQGNNQRRNRMCNYKGEHLTIMQLSERYEIEYNTLRGRLNKGWSVIDAVETPVKHSRKKVA